MSDSFVDIDNLPTSFSQFPEDAYAILGQNWSKDALWQEVNADDLELYQTLQVYLHQTSGQAQQVNQTAPQAVIQGPASTSQPSLADTQFWPQGPEGASEFVLGAHDLALIAAGQDSQPLPAGTISELQDGVRTFSGELIAQDPLLALLGQDPQPSLAVDPSWLQGPGGASSFMLGAQDFTLAAPAQASQPLPADSPFFFQGPGGVFVHPYGAQDFALAALPQAPQPLPADPQPWLQGPGGTFDHPIEVQDSALPEPRQATPPAQAPPARPAPQKRRFGNGQAADQTARESRYRVDGKYKTPAQRKELKRAGGIAAAHLFDRDEEAAKCAQALAWVQTAPM